MAQYNGFAVDSDAALTIITSGEVVAKNNTNLREDIIQLLKGIEIEFAQNLKKTFKVFEKFNDIPDLLFPVSIGPFRIIYFLHFFILINTTDRWRTYLRSLNENKILNVFRKANIPLQVNYYQIIVQIIHI